MLTTLVRLEEYAVKTKIKIVIILVICAASFLLSLTTVYISNAATTLPTKMNFQGRLTNTAGNILPNGTYNMRFRIWDASTGGTQQWSEDRLVSASQGVTVTNGQFSVQLGSVSSLPASVFASSSLYFEVELPTPATATSASPSWTEGAMTPRNQLATSAYAYNAETLDGIDSDAFAKLGTSNAFMGATSIDVASVNAFQVKNGSNSLFNVSTNDSQVTIGTSDTSGSLLVLDTKTGAGDPIGVNGAMYYNANVNKFRCHQNGVWADCVAGGLQQAYDNTAGSPATITTTAGKGVLIAAGAVPTTSLFSVSNSSQAVTTNNVNGINVAYTGGSAAVEGAGIRVDYTPGGTSGGTWSGMRIVANATGAASGVNSYGLKIEGPSSAGAGTDTGLKIATGFDIGLDVASGGLQLASQSDPAAPADGNLRVYAKSVSGRMLLKVRGPSGLDYPLQPSLFQNQVCMISAGTATTMYSFGCAPSYSGTRSHPTPSQSSGFMTNFATSTTAGNEAGFVSSVAQFFQGNQVGSNGYFFNSRIYTVDSAGIRMFVGLNSQSTLPNMLASDNVTGSRAGFSFSTVRGDTNWQFTTRDGTTENLTDTTMPYADSKVYDFYVFTPPYPNNGTVFWRIDNITDGTTEEGSTSTNLPNGSTVMRAANGIETQAAVAKNFRVQRMYVETDQ